MLDVNDVGAGLELPRLARSCLSLSPLRSDKLPDTEQFEITQNEKSRRALPKPDGALRVDHVARSGRRRGCGFSSATLEGAGVDIVFLE